jgi:hypothetical protein
MAEWTRGVCITLVAAGRRGATSLWGCVLAMAVRGDHQGTPPAEATPIPCPPATLDVLGRPRVVLSTGHAAHPLRGAQGAGAGVGIAHAMPLSCTPGGWTGMGVRFDSLVFFGLDEDARELHETWLDPTTPSKVSTRAKSPRHLRYAT